MITWNRTRAAVVGLVIASAASAPAQEKSIAWRSDYDAARKESTEKGKPIFLEFHTDNCFHCRRLEAGPFRDPGLVARFNEHFIPLRLDGNLVPRLVQALQIKAYPTMIVASPDGKILGVMEGYLDTQPLGDHLTKIVGESPKAGTAKVFEEAAKAAEAGKYAQAIPLLKKAANENPKAKVMLEEVEQMAAGRLTRVKQLHDSGRSAEALDLLADLAVRYSGTAAAVEGAKIARALAEDGKLAKGRTAKEILVAAQQAVEQQRFDVALELCELLEADYGESAEAKPAAELARAVRANPERLAMAGEAVAERLAGLYAELAEGALKKGDRDLATAYLEKAVRAAPASVVARDAQAKLVPLTKRIQITPSVRAKPEK